MTGVRFPPLLIPAPMPFGTLLAVVIVSFNTREHLRGCLPTVVTEAPRAIVVADNGSSHGSIDMVRGEFSSSVEIDVDRTNPGYAAAPIVDVDDEVGSNGSVIFQVWADAGKLSESAVLKGTIVTMGLSGQSELRLVVTDAGDGNAYDHGNWASARFVCDGMINRGVSEFLCVRRDRVRCSSRS